MSVRRDDKILAEFIRLELQEKGKVLPILGLATAAMVGRVATRDDKPKPPEHSRVQKAPEKKFSLRRFFKQDEKPKEKPKKKVRPKPAPAPERPHVPAGERRYTEKTHTEEELVKIVHQAAEAEGLDPAFLDAIAYVESRYKPQYVYGEVLSSSGAEGMMQFVPSTAREMDLDNPSDPEKAAPAGAKYLKKLMALYDGDMFKAAAAYNVGHKYITAHLKQHGTLDSHAQAMRYITAVKKRMAVSPLAEEPD